jgi:hypothetical protein
MSVTVWLDWKGSGRSSDVNSLVSRLATFEAARSSQSIFKERDGEFQRPSRVLPERKEGIRDHAMAFSLDGEQ